MSQPTTTPQARTESSTQSGSSTQYNTISASYQKFYPPDGQASPYAFGQLEENRLRATLTSPSIDIKGKKVLDLACGSAFYTLRFLSWGAESVVGLDISEGMVHAARQDAAGRGLDKDGRARFVVGDATDDELVVDADPHGGRGEKFDIVTGVWLLNYAPDRAGMRKMWDTIGRHLKPDGVFVGLTIPPLLVPGLRAEKDWLDAVLAPDGPCGKYGNRGKVIEEVEDGRSGYKVYIELGFREVDGEEGVVGFDCYYLRNEVFEGSCEDSGLFEPLEWLDFVVPEELRKQRPVGFWNDFIMCPNFRICVARRKM